MKTVAEKKKEDCCGCSACFSVCPHGAINMTPDGMGFLYPRIDTAKCIECGLCVKICQFKDNYDKVSDFSNPIVFAFRHKDMKEMEKSQSGGAFALLSDFILENGGVVYGAGYQGHFRVVHKRATTKEERDEFRGSKYVQSDLCNAFNEVKNDLKNGLTVMFSGTPCQTSGLIKFVGPKLRERLFVMDIVCHGVPAPFVWRDYIEWLEKKKSKKIIKVNFRNKPLFGWKSHKETFEYEDDTYTYTYTYTFYQHVNLRYSCYNCKFTNTCHPSDITVCDYWGIERLSKTFAADNKGCSLILINTNKGIAWFDSIKNRADVLESNIDLCLQPQLQHPAKMHPDRAKYEEDFINKGFPYVAYRYGDLGWRYYIKKSYRVLRTFVGDCLRALHLRKKVNK
ncbi:MAG: Coenzyme F420 hydrogenase/dehydrogenase, beta subunit C-terminal domain [Muribaculaceae bacterium]